MQSTAVAGRWGMIRYGTLSGFCAAPFTAATALVPCAGRALAEATGSFAGAFGLLAAVVAAAVLVWRARTRQHPRAWVSCRVQSRVQQRALLRE